MDIVVLIPALVLIAALFRDSLHNAFTRVYLPLLVLFPCYYYWKVESLPPIDMTEAVLVPLGLAVLVKEWTRWRFSIMDLAIVLFVFSCGHADALSGKATASTFATFNGVAEALIPYILGKLLIEKDGGRVAALRSLVFSLAVSSIIAAYEFRMQQNPFTMIASHIFPDEHFTWKTQLRWGFGRVAGAFGQSELAGMVLIAGVGFALYLSYTRAWEPKIRNLEWLPWSKNRWMLITLFGGLLMTQARGPWLGALAVIPITLVGQTRRVLRNTLVVGLLLVVLGSVSWVGMKAYTSGPVESVEQENATYRAQLLDNYLPIALVSGPWGYGQDFPRAPGQESIDNEYLFLALVQGWVGLLTFCVLGLGTLYHLGMGAVLSQRKQDRAFCYTLGGIMVGLMVTLYTVFLGNQAYQIFFLIAGWAQAMHPHRAEQPMPVFAEVYT